ncbi:MAG: hypothetical protein JW873_06040 [Candidatus Saganbacteria bacterium]|nr:hypothetical protein [Candidatus Saganbacteria bacterium]
MSTKQTGEQARFLEVLKKLTTHGGPESERRAVLGFHELLRDRADFPNYINEIIVRTVGLYRKTDYIRGRLIGLVTADELLMIEQNLNDFISLHNHPLSQLPPDIRNTAESDIPFARFYAGLFALARGNYDSAAVHFSRAALGREQEKERGYNNCGADPKVLAHLLEKAEERKPEEAAAKLGTCFIKLKANLGPTSAVPVASGREKTLVFTVPPVAEATPTPAAPEPSPPPARPGWLSRLKKKQ